MNSTKANKYALNNNNNKNSMNHSESKSKTDKLNKIYEDDFLSTTFLNHFKQKKKRTHITHIHTLSFFFTLF